MHLRRLTPADAADYRTVLLQGYEAPGAFTATRAERAALPLDWWEARVSDRPDADQLVVGAFLDARLVGVAGLRRRDRERTRHKATLFGVAVRPEARGQGVARALVEAVLDHARSTPSLRLVQLSVVASNARARRLYEACGFRAYGTEPDALRDGDHFHALVHMWRPVADDEA